MPSGASTGEYEDPRARDGDPKRYRGKGVLKAVENVNTKIAPVLVGMDVLDQAGIDNMMLEIDGTETKSNLGANATTACPWRCQPLQPSWACRIYRYVGGAFAPGDTGPHAQCHQRRQARGQQRGSPGVHDRAHRAHRTSGRPSDYSGPRPYMPSGNILFKSGYATGVGDEGGFAPNLKSNTEPSSSS